MLQPGRWRVLLDIDAQRDDDAPHWLTDGARILKLCAAGEMDCCGAPEDRALDHGDRQPLEPAPARVQPVVRERSERSYDIGYARTARRHRRNRCGEREEGMDM